ncbi:MAG: RIP metalloprotease RseP [Bacteroidales bacterium]|nr:RIP metalloprotease RseP [Bacteroidales bacterium]
MTIVLIKTLQVILALSILILVHEFGHFLFAKIFGIRVDKFYLFFDAGDKRIFSTKSKWFTKICPKAAQWETEYGIGWLPLGGYCKIAGMVDESMDTEYLQNEPQPWEFRTKPAWQRLLVMAGGVLFNFIFAILMYTCILTRWGDSYISNEGNSIYVNELAYDMGFRNGDQILLFDDEKPENFGMLQADLARNGVKRVTVLRDNDTINIYIDQNMIGDVLQSPGMFGLAVPFVISEVSETSPNRDSDLRAGDKVISIGGVNVEFLQDARPLLMDLAGETAEISLLRGADTVRMDVQVDTAGTIGVMLERPYIKTKEYSFLSAIPGGCVKAYETIGGYIQDLKLVFTPSTEAYKSVGSFIAIGQVFPSAWDWYSFLNILALLSIMLGVMNLLPIPALDGGHIVFTIYEMITGRKPSDKFLYIMQIIGMILVFGLMFLAFGNDIARLLR